ncbi:hypothetical protein Mapa_012076 [Marchantia paleacea]|nr:hypothetical protein Mapa_012076 [Marchantia paleacea]
MIADLLHHGRMKASYNSVLELVRSSNEEREVVPASQNSSYNKVVLTLCDRKAELRSMDC